MTTESPLYHPTTLFDVLRLPLIGRLLRWRWGRLVLQIPLVIVSALLLYDGFTGPQRASENLATVLPWVHYRGLVVIALLLAGNLFCMGCPFTLPRTLAKRLSIRGRRFPQRLRNKWLAIAGLFTLFFLYEFLDLWASPLLTAWVIVFYFVASFVLEAVFTESAFCKYVCPMGSFNFAYSTTSPLQITSRDFQVCAACVGKECVNGSYSPEPMIRLDQIPVQQEGAAPKMVQKEVRHGPEGTLGCGTLLFVPQIKSNMDCVFCLDCARACPHNNVALTVRKPGHELLQPDAWPKRWDVAFFIFVLTFMGLSNAFGMVPPIYELERSLSEMLRIDNELVILLITFFTIDILFPLVTVLLAGWLSQLLTNTAKKYDLRQTVTSFAPAFVPLSFGIWFAHYSFHFLTGFLTIIPVFQNFLLDNRIDILGQPNWSLSGLQDANLVTLIQIIGMLAGFFGSLYVAQHIAMRLYRRDAVMGLLPWALLFLAIALIALAIFSLPMEMRGTIFAS